MYHLFGKGHIVAWNKEDFPDELWHYGNLNNTADQVLACFVCRVGLSGKNKLNRHFGIVYNLVQPVNIGKKQMGPFVCCKPSGKTNGKNVVPQALLYLYHLAGCIMGDRCGCRK
ncbi:hypothetical protein SDC9_159890 [bioreactor metagenome]|uniref:Uncharacterized protein n=1 Tax=bioreactor metagenome TaxID=1076179 RepID=A0A645FGF8_9ZZZZ